ncbi:hypothetical protein AMS68_005735 [Peltaster fructicola]|uniref:RNA helicase n=1 Tax=Peltaster fructicola TaxID=286661 RepID=A0A6H0Y049_9PEZI|nr:hypothetical protein AMS68_005735 [Peltaster fructicola]
MKRKHAEAEPRHDSLQHKKQKLLVNRQRLPIWSRKADIQHALEQHDVLVLSGETGSGKSTQIPQFLLESKWCTKCIAVTQPRRVAAISLARRVAEEMGSPLGSSSPASRVGYSVRFDESVSPSTRIKYLTEGMLLQEMLRDATLPAYSCIIVDEVHERSVNVDLLLGFLKSLLTSKARKTPLKLVVMSATADIDSITNFFKRADNAVAEDTHKHGTLMPTAALDRVIKVHVEGRQFPVKLHYLDRASDDLVQTALERIFSIHTKEPLPGDILVFLTGQEVIQTLQKLVEEYAEQLPKEVPKVVVLPLFAALSQDVQQRIFQPAPARTRKIILSTNIAETSVTVPGVRYVIDTGKAKIKQYRNRLALDSLLVKSISKSSADQRKGRAGREAPGQCYRLYTESAYSGLDFETKPEILRCDLSESMLKMKARGVQDVMSFPLLTSPPTEAIEKALLQLLQLNAIQDDGKITSMGKQIARLPLSPTLGRVLIEAAKADFNCVLDVIDIVACLSVENVFLHVETEDKREEAQEARLQLFRRQGDHLTLLAAVRGYAAEQTDRKKWSEKFFVSHRAMQSVMDVRKQLRAQCLQAKLIKTEDIEAEQHAIDEEHGIAVLKCFLRGAFPNNVARLCPDGSYKTLIGNQVVAIHPSSFLFGKKVEAILYNEFVFTNKAYARVVSVIQLSWLNQLLDS